MITPPDGRIQIQNNFTSTTKGDHDASKSFAEAGSKSFMKSPPALIGMIAFGAGIIVGFFYWLMGIARCEEGE
jgi:hypothetical protein